MLMLCVSIAGVLGLSESFPAYTKLPDFRIWEVHGLLHPAFQQAWNPVWFLTIPEAALVILNSTTTSVYSDCVGNLLLIPRIEPDGCMVHVTDSLINLSIAPHKMTILYQWCFVAAVGVLQVTGMVNCAYLFNPGIHTGLDHIHWTAHRAN